MSSTNNPARTDPLWVESVPPYIDRDMRRYIPIGQGFQYTAYESEGEVLKIPLTAEQTANKFEKLGLGEADLGKIEADRKESLVLIAAVRERLTDGSFPSDILGDAVIAENGEIRQPLLTPVGKAFETATHAEKMEILAGYGNCIERLIRLGTFETGFALLSNFGINKNRQVVVLDFGELTFSRSEALDITERKVWESKREAVNELPEPYKGIYLKMMAEVLTKENILSGWGQTSNS